MTDTANSKISRETEQLKQFLVTSTDYYIDRFELITHGQTMSFNQAAALFGPLWASSRNLWSLFWMLAVTDIAGLILLGRSLWGGEEYAGSSGTLGIAIVLLGRIAAGFLANNLYHGYYNKWRINPALNAGLSQRRGMIGAALMMATYPLTVYRFTAPDVVKYLETFPTSKKIAKTTAKAIDNAVDWLTISFEGLFESITWMIREILDFLELLFIGTPWPVMALLLVLTAWKFAGWRVVAFTVAALAYLGFFGFWDKAMSTMALVGASVFICLAIGAPLGIVAAKSPRFNAVLNPLLDLMQTMPSFVYLIPAIAFFSVGKPPAVLATVVFAMPPMIRLTTLGIQGVSPSVIEAMQAFGASPRQILFKAELPLAVPAIMAGINQSIMMSLSMVVVAALIGAGGLGYDVLFSLQHLEAGKGLLAGLAIVLCAMILDRIIQGDRKK